MFNSLLNRINEELGDVEKEEKVDLVGRYIDGDYLVYVADPSVETKDVWSDRFWPDYLMANRPDKRFGSEPFTAVCKELRGVPRDLADKLLKQGGSDQWFDDGHDAAQAAAPYVVEKGGPDEGKKRIVGYEIVEHGIENSKYFPGHGTTGTDFTNVATSAGDNPAEALGNVLCLLAQRGWDVSRIVDENKNFPTKPSLGKGEDNVYYYVSVLIK